MIGALTTGRTFVLGPETGRGTSNQGVELRYAVALAVVLFAVWLLWSGHTEPLLLSLGVVSVLTAVGLTRRMGLLDAETVPLKLTFRAVRYVPWLLFEIVKSNLDVARRILDPRLPIAPRVIRVRAGQRTDLGRVIYANSITLTPGTVTVDAEGDSFTVHALTAEAADGVRSGEMDRRVSRVEGDS
jgi:multicomponent Na+:H+ antiporter subunit E